MSIDYYNCEICGEIFNDCAPHTYCHKCETMMCGRCQEKQSEKYGTIGEREEAYRLYGPDATMGCDICQGEIIKDSVIIEYLLDKLGIFKEQAIEEIKEKANE